MSKEFSDTVANDLAAIALVEAIDVTLNRCNVVMVDYLGNQHKFAGCYAFSASPDSTGKATLVLWEGHNPQAVNIADLITKGAC